MSDGTAEASLEVREKGSLACSHLSQTGCVRDHIQQSGSKISTSQEENCILTVFDGCAEAKAVLFKFG